MSRIVIIGNGVAGITAARHIRKRSDHELLVISSETEHFFSRTALMYVYMGHMRFEDIKPYEDRFWEVNRIGLLQAHVESVEVASKLLRCSDGQEIRYDTLIIATGSRSNRFGWPGQDLEGVQGLYSWQDLQLLEEKTRGIHHAVVVGGGLIGAELCEMLTSRRIAVTFLVREASWMDLTFPPAESQMINDHFREHRIDLRLGTELERIEADPGGRRAVAAITSLGERIGCQLVGLTVGVSPSIGFLEGSGIECDSGVLVDRFLRASAPDVYAVGDCAQLREPRPGRRAIEAVWYVARAMGETASRTVTGEPTPYEQSVWFNSAKLLDLEWQTYGDVPPEAPEGHESLLWKHPSGRISIRINYRRDDEAVTGFNLIGVRYRHELCDEWIRRGATIRHVLAHLGAASFDPELSSQHEHHLVALYNQRNPDRAVRLRYRRGLRSVLAARRA